MQNYVPLTTTNLASAISAATAFVAYTLQSSVQKIGRLSNNFNVDLAMQLTQAPATGSALGPGGVSPFYVPAGGQLLLDLGADNVKLESGFNTGLQVSVWAPNGVAPATGSGLFDCIA